MKALILAGGKGTRLRSKVTDRPKPMALVAGRPFLFYLLDDLGKHGATGVVLSVGYMGDLIESAIVEAAAAGAWSFAISFVHEETPLGTGGAIKFACECAFSPDEQVVVMNGDSYLPVDYAALMALANRDGSDLALIAHPVSGGTKRYGLMMVANGCVSSFSEKVDSASGLINGGVYCLRPKLFAGWRGETAFSFERDFLPDYCVTHRVPFQVSGGYFIDIGEPADYERAQKELPGNVR